MEAACRSSLLDVHAVPEEKVLLDTSAAPSENLASNGFFPVSVRTQGSLLALWAVSIILLIIGPCFEVPWSIARAS